VNVGVRPQFQTGRGLLIGDLVLWPTASKGPGSVAVCAVLSVLWICYPRFRVLYALCMIAVAIALVAANFHFLGDVIAGAFLGISTGWLTVAIWEAGARQVSVTKLRGDAPNEKSNS